jgi:hypothetical protein
MDESLQAFLQNLLARPSDPEGDYQDMLANYMNQANQGSFGTEDFGAAMSILPRERLAGISQYAPGNLAAESIPNVKEHRDRLNALLQQLMRGR